jgi:capsid protein
MFIRKGQDKMSSLPMSGAAVLTGEVSPGLAGGATTTPRNFSLADQIPGVVFEELQQGEEPVGFDNRGTDTAFPVFEASIISAIAWTQEIPPEILTLSFNSNYSASQAALNEFRIYLELRRVDFGEQFLSHVYSDWLLSEVLRGRVDAASLPAAAANLERFDIAAAWTCADWTGAIKPTTDPLKAVRAAIEAIDAGLMTREYASATLYGRHFEQNAKVLGRENQTLADINAPLADAAGEILTPDTDTDEDEPDVDDNDEDGEPANEEDE